MSTHQTTLKRQLQIIVSVWHRTGPNCDRLVHLERIFLVLLCLMMFLTPGMWVRHLGGVVGDRKTRKSWVEFYAVTKILLTVAILMTGLSANYLVRILSIWLLADVFISLAGYIFLRKFWQNPYSWNRSLLLVLVNFAEYALWFAILYLSFGCLKPSGETPITTGDAIYFSIVTAATVGYGDITPYPGTGRLLVSLQICASLFFMAAVVAYFVSNMTQPERDKEE